MTNENTTLARFGVSTAVPITANSLADMGCEAVSFLPRVELMTASKKPVKSGQYTQLNTYALATTADSQTCLGKQIEAVIIDWRPFAMDFKTKKRFYVQDCEGFKDIEKRSDFKDAGCAAGPQFLLWLPDVKKMAIWWANNKSSKFAWTRATEQFAPEDGQYNLETVEFDSIYQDFSRGAQQVPKLTFKADRPKFEPTDEEVEIITRGVTLFKKDAETAAANEEIPEAGRSR